MGQLVKKKLAVCLLAMSVDNFLINFLRRFVVSGNSKLGISILKRTKPIVQEGSGGIVRKEKITRLLGISDCEIFLWQPYFTFVDQWKHLWKRVYKRSTT